MNKYFLCCLTAVAFIFKSLAQSPIDYVNPFIGSSNFGATNPGAVVPQGLVSVAPFNVTGSKENIFDKDARWWSTPYAYENSYFTGFSHVNLSGVGCPELGTILLMPTTGKVEADITKYGSAYENETASPGYYSNFLSKYKIKTEATASQRVGLSRFVFPEGKSNILINLGDALTNEVGGSIDIVNETEVEGWRMTGSFCYNDGSERPVYFVAKFSKPFKSSGVWKQMPEMQAEASWSATSGKIKYYEGYSAPIAGDKVGAWLSFDTKDNEEVLVKIGVSYVSIDNARENLKVEMPGFDFDKILSQAKESWTKALSKIEVEGGTDEQKIIFYTSLYHINLHPNVISDVNGQYPKMESYDIGQVKSRERYTVFSLWDTYRNVHPFMSLVYPKQQLDMVNSLIDMYKESGWLPKWELNSKETHVMEGDPSIPVIVDTYFRGLRDFDHKMAYEAMFKSATATGKDNKLRPDNDDYLSKGYVPLMKEFDNSVSHALEYYIADWNLAQFANALGKKDDYSRFFNQSLRYKEYFDKEFNMIRPKLADGTFLPTFDPKQGENFAPSPGFHEGNAWQYTLYVPHDINGIKKLMGGNKVFVNTLQKIFDDKHFDMANEPDINYPYLFNYVKGEEWRTQQQVRKLINTYYKNSPDGIPGNDDCGTLSTWAVFSMIGIYPVCPGNMDFAITSPIFDKVTIHLDSDYYNGEKLVINTKKSDTKDIYIDKMIRNGKPWNKYFISHQEITKGGIFNFELKNKP
ncbi:GH92 family glycosyl hydrolase [Reichenbachiella sp. MALMAid0571]|uniref:GH92 family glycosyl hydrolase n=1 Tax=Reichenbachiella sp. MALMAid0571 TaxID=3143939 RepID=UPI0032DFC260